MWTGKGTDEVYAGRDDDILHTFEDPAEPDDADCGPGVDLVHSDQSDVLRHCERRLTRSK